MYAFNSYKQAVLVSNSTEIYYSGGNYYTCPAPSSDVCCNPSDHCIELIDYKKDKNLLKVKDIIIYQKSVIKITEDNISLYENKIDDFDGSVFILHAKNLDAPSGQIYSKIPVSESLCNLEKKLLSKQLYISNEFCQYDLIESQACLIDAMYSDFLYEIRDMTEKERLEITLIDLKEEWFEKGRYGSFEEFLANSGKITLI